MSGDIPVPSALQGSRIHPICILERAWPAHAVELEKIEKLYHGVPWSLEGFLGEMANTARGSRVWLSVARRDRKDLAGYICFRILPDEIYVLNLTVTQRYRRMGIGRFMLTAALRFGLKQGVRRAVLDVDGNNQPAVRLYKAMGFRFVTGSIMRGRAIMALNMIDCRVVDGCEKS